MSVYVTLKGKISIEANYSSSDLNNPEDLEIIKKEIQMIIDSLQDIDFTFIDFDINNIEFSKGDE